MQTLTLTSPDGPRLGARLCDTDTAIEALMQAAPDVSLYLIGHSLGAQLPGLLKHRDRVGGLVSIAAGSGYWRDNALQLKRIVLYFWHVLVPDDRTRHPCAGRRYANSPRRVERIAPADVNVKRIGHFGFFRDQFQSSLWMRSAALLQGFSQGNAGPPQVSLNPSGAATGSPVAWGA